MNCVFISVLIFASVVRVVDSHGLLLLYRPRDITSDCVFSEQLRFDISFGMGMSDTLTLVFRTLTLHNYQCKVDIVTEPAGVYIITVIKFPTSISLNCNANPDAFTVMKKQSCIRICDSIGDRDVHSPYFVVAVRGRIRFQFLSNSSINSDIRANLYQVTVTAARAMPKRGCRGNETLCSVGHSDMCFTTGVVCDGINNCGVTDWYDERKSSCSLPVEKLGFAPVVAVTAGVLCALLAAGHILLRCLPPLANSFFIFNVNEDNRLCLDPVFISPGMRFGSIDKPKKISVIPVSCSSSSNETNEEEVDTDTRIKELTIDEMQLSEHEIHRSPARKSTLKYMTEKIQKTFRSKKSVGVMHI